MFGWLVRGVIFEYFMQLCAIALGVTYRRCSVTHEPMPKCLQIIRNDSLPCTQQDEGVCGGRLLDGLITWIR